MSEQRIALLGTPIDCGKRRAGCLMGPDALRTGGLADVLRGLGHHVSDLGNVMPQPYESQKDMATPVHARAETIAWTKAIAEAGEVAARDALPIFMGGDHAMSLGSVLAMTRRAAAANQPLFVLWLDAHTDYHTPETTQSGHLHGTPIGYVTGRMGFDGFPEVEHPVPHRQIAMIGLRSVDPEERSALQETDVAYIDMRRIDEDGISRPLGAFLDRVAAAEGHLHVSFDVDFLDPGIAPAVGTTVPGGATLREAHLAMEMICDSGLMTSLDLAELNPFLDERGRTASLMVDLVASAFGRRIFDRPTRDHG